MAPGVCLPGPFNSLGLCDGPTKHRRHHPLTFLVNLEPPLGLYMANINPTFVQIIEPEDSSGVFHGEEARGLDMSTWKMLKRH